MYLALGAETNTNTRRVLVKDFGIQIIKLVLEYLLRSRDSAHMMYLSSGSYPMKTVEFDWHHEH